VSSERPVFNEDRVEWNGKISHQNSPTVCPDSTQQVSNSQDQDSAMTPAMNADARHSSGKSGENIQFNKSGVESSHLADSLSFAPRIENASDLQSVLQHNSDRLDNARNSQCIFSDGMENGLKNFFQKDNYPKNEEYYDTAAPYHTTPEVHSQEISSTDLESWSSNCQNSTKDFCKMPLEAAELQPPRKDDDFSNFSDSSQYAVSYSDRAIVSGIGDNAPVIDNMPTLDDIAMEGDGVVFNTSDFAVKSKQETANGLVEEFCESANCNDALRWDVKSLDLPRKEQIIYDKDAEGLALLKQRVYRNESNNEISVQSDNSELFSPPSKESSPISDAANNRINPMHFRSAEIRAQIFSDISDDDDVDSISNNKLKLCSNSEANAESKWPIEEEIQSVQTAVATNEIQSILKQSNMEISATSQHASAMICDNIYNDIVRQNADEPLTFSAQQDDSKEALSEDTTGQTTCDNATTSGSFMDNENKNIFPQNTDSTAKLPISDCSVVHSLTEMASCDFAMALRKRTWDMTRMRRRRRNKSGTVTLSGVVIMLRKSIGISDNVEMELETDAKELDHQSTEGQDDEIMSLPLSPEQPVLCEDKPDSVMDEAPTLLAITDLLNNDTNGAEQIKIERRTATAGNGYESDDAEVAMPVIEDMRPILSAEDPTENELCEQRAEVKSDEDSLRKVRRKLSKPLKRVTSAAGKEVLEIRRTENLSVVCDRCTFACGSEQALHQHIKLSHRFSSTRSGKRPQYVCAECPAVSDDLEWFLDHLAHHPSQHSIRYYMCSHCGTDAADMESMEVHVSSNHDETAARFEVVRERVSFLNNLVNCPLCDAACRWKKSIVNHVRSYHQMDQLAAYLEHKCPDQLVPDRLIVRRDDVMGRNAGYRGEVSSATNSNSRYRDLRDPSSSNVVVHICCRCTFSTDDIDSYLQHYKGHFSTTKLTREARTSVTARNADRELPRSDQMVLEPPTEKVGGSYFCHLCPFKTPKRMFYHRHMAIHERNSGMTDGYRCGYCQFAHPRSSCITFHLGRYHSNRPHKIIRIFGGVESEMSLDGQGDVDEEETVSRSTVTREVNINQPPSRYDSLLDSSFSSAATPSKSTLAINQKSRQLANNRVQTLNDFERRLPPSMVYPEPIKCPLCSFTNTIRITLIRHLRTHKNDEEEDDEIVKNSVEDNMSESAVEQSRNGGTTADSYFRAAAGKVTAMNKHEASMNSSWTKARTAQQRIEDCLVNIQLFRYRYYGKILIFVAADLYYAHNVNCLSSSSSSISSLCVY